MSLPRAYVPVEPLASLAPGASFTLEGEEAHHLLVLRLGPGSPCALFDGAGRVARALVETAGRGSVELRVTSVEDHPPWPGPSLELLVAVLKSDKLEWAVQKLTELGVDRILPVVTERSVARPREAAAARRHERLTRILREATRQSGRAYVPRLDPVVPLDEALAEEPLAGDLSILCWEEAPNHSRLGARLEGAAAASRVRLLVGPEGGFTAAEAALAERRGFVPASLGALILRAETAAVATCALVAHRIGRVG